MFHLILKPILWPFLFTRFTWLPESLSNIPKITYLESRKHKDQSWKSHLIDSKSPTFLVCLPWDVSIANEGKNSLSFTQSYRPHLGKFVWHSYPPEEQPRPLGGGGDQGTFQNYLARISPTPTPSNVAKSVVIRQENPSNNKLSTVSHGWELKGTEVKHGVRGTGGW